MKSNTKENFKTLDKHLIILSKEKTSKYQKFIKAKYVIDNHYCDNKITNEEAYNRMIYIDKRMKIYSQLSLPSLITILFGIYVSTLFFFYQLVDTKIIQPFRNSIEELLNNNGYEMSQINEINNGQVAKYVNSILIYLILIILGLILIITIEALVYYWLLHREISKNILNEKLKEHELRILYQMLELNNENYSVKFKIKNGQNTLVYKLENVIPQIE
ncbi:protein of unknown function [Petrocella atlantisensis]|uniref:Uncharacterized protein n=1 Tax=Petrocella atlantisensis TaxID=2173034 RepID=A0A3P7PNY6_9FIRM|nr:hypothetical protein [Petrocella atlantisensis]VDN46207.1 protein of unknown function [Petrocella atlantisensis]